ncbi:hypothetical protein M569_02736, partial [Genlisea aurea]
EMSNTSNVAGLRYRGGSSGLPSVSRFRSGYLPSGMNVGRVTDNLSGSDMDTCSDSEGECYGARYSPESSPQDDKIQNGARRAAFLNARISDSGDLGSYLERQGARARGYSNDYESSESVSSSEISSAPAKPTGTETVSGNKVFLSTDDSANPVSRNKFDEDIPSAPPLAAGSLHHVHQASETRQQARADSKFSSGSSKVSAVEPDLNTQKNKIRGSTDFNTAADSISAAPAPRYPTFHASGLGYWHAVLSYDACVRLCLHSWARGCMEAPVFLENECALLRDSFGLKQILLQSEEELLHKEASELVSEGASVKTKKTIGKIKIQVRKVKMGLEPPTGCTFASLKSQSSVKLESFQHRLSSVKSVVSSERKALKSERVPAVITVKGSLFHKGMAYIILGTRRYLKEVPELIKVGFNAWRGSSTSYEVVQESYSCLLRLKSSNEEEVVRMQPGSGESRVFLPDGLADDILIEVHDSKGRHCGHAVLQVADIADESGEKLRSCFLYREPEHEQVGRIQFSIVYSSTPDENSHKCTPVAETIAYDCVLETAMKIQQFQQRNLLLHGPWKWLVTEFASYFGVSDAYTKLRYLSYVMDVATPTADCLDLVNELLLPVVIKGKTKHSLSHQEIRLLGEVSDEIDQILTLAFENYKSLDESSPSGVVDVFVTGKGVTAPALAPALKLYKLLHDILTPEVQSRLCRYFQ